MVVMVVVVVVVCFHVAEDERRRCGEPLGEATEDLQRGGC